MIDHWRLLFPVYIAREIGRAMLAQKVYSLLSLYIHV